MRHDPDDPRSYRSQSIPWLIIADENYGEGSSREVAAMSPRYMGGFGVIAKGMARLHETVSRVSGSSLFGIGSGDAGWVG